mgnify:CR=1 FL=1
MANILEITDVHKSYKTDDGPLKVLQNVNFTIEENSWTILLGASGSGKSTLLQLLGALDRPCSGKITLRGKDYSRFGAFKSAKMRQQKIGFVFQSFNLFPELTALENVMLPAMFNSDKKSVEAKAKELLTMIGLDHRLTHRPNALSGGEQQRVAIARALINDPEIILADEPTGNLDPKTGQQIIDLFKTLQKEQGKTIIMVTHNHELSRFADSTYFLTKGHLEEYGEKHVQ